jgi:phosphate transport system ATP-binding protein
VIKPEIFLQTQRIPELMITSVADLASKKESLTPVLATENLNAYYDEFHALKDINLDIVQNKITAIIGPSGCGKSTLIRCYNRMNDYVKSFSISGKILFKNKNIYSSDTDVRKLRKNIGMVFQRPNPFPLSIYENIVYGIKIHGESRHDKLSEIVEKSLSATYLWNELKDKLSDNALTLSAEQRQRLCISRLLAVSPEILLMDEPCSALDPVATLKIEELFVELKTKYTVVIVTHNMQQAARISDFCCLMWLGDVVEYGNTKTIFTSPKNKKTEDYITGRFG